MRQLLFLVTAIGLLTLTAAAQIDNRRPFIRASGEGVVTIRPDQAEVNVGVTTRANTAQEAAAQNASQTSAVLTALRQLLGANALIETVGYSVQPNYRYPQGGGNPELAGFTANNTVRVTVGDLSRVGTIIDTAVSAGATTITSLNFTLKDPAPARAQALRAATQQAKASAEAIAQGLGVRLGAVVRAEEGQPVRVLGAERATLAATTTPIEPGSVDVRATVTIEAEIQ